MLRKSGCWENEISCTRSTWDLRTPRWDHWQPQPPPGNRRYCPAGQACGRWWHPLFKWSRWGKAGSNLLVQWQWLLFRVPHTRASTHASRTLRVEGVREKIHTAHLAASCLLSRPRHLSIGLFRCRGGWKPSKSLSARADEPEGILGRQSCEIILSSKRVCGRLSEWDVE